MCVGGGPHSRVWVGGITHVSLWGGILHLVMCGWVCGCVGVGVCVCGGGITQLPKQANQQVEENNCCCFIFPPPCIPSDSFPLSP